MTEISKWSSIEISMTQWWIPTVENIGFDEIYPHVLNLIRDNSVKNIVCVLTDDHAEFFRSDEFVESEVCKLWFEIWPDEKSNFIYWLISTLSLLDGKTPYELLKEWNYDEVENLLHKIERWTYS